MYKNGRFKPRGKTPLSIEIRRKIKAELLERKYHSTKVKP